MATNLEFIKSASGTNVSSLTVTDCFSDKYDVYDITFNFAGNSVTGYIEFRLLDSTGTEISSAEYDVAGLMMRSYNTYIENRSVNTTGYTIGYNQDFGLGGKLTIFNPYDSSSYTFLLNQNAGGTTSAGQLIGWKGIMTHKVAETISGIKFFVSGGGSYDFNYIEASVFGVK